MDSKHDQAAAVVFAVDLLEWLDGEMARDPHEWLADDQLDCGWAGLKHVRQELQHRLHVLRVFGANTMPGTPPKKKPDESQQDQPLDEVPTVELEQDGGDA